jgi:hypothetical protein
VGLPDPRLSQGLADVWHAHTAAVPTVLVEG